MALAFRKHGLWIAKLTIGRAAFALLVVLAFPFSESAIAAPAGGALNASRFSISIDGTEIASFSELQGITTSVQVPTSSTGPLTKSATVVLTRGMTRSIEMAAWHELVILGDVAAARKNVSIIAYGADGKPVARYHLTAAWPSKIEIGTLKAGDSEALMETVTITCEFIQRIAV
jgi:phage tail-like protein